MLSNVWIRADRQDGNDPLEAETVLPIIPRKGDLIEVEHPSGTDFLHVVDVVIPIAQTLARPQPPLPVVQVWVQLDGYDLDLLHQVMMALRTGYAAASRRTCPRAPRSATTTAPESWRA